MIHWRRPQASFVPLGRSRRHDALAVVISLRR
jgi:hypothetical protein